MRVSYDTVYIYICIFLKYSINECYKIRKDLLDDSEFNDVVE